MVCAFANIKIENLASHYVGSCLHGFDWSNETVECVKERPALESRARCNGPIPPNLMAGTLGVSKLCVINKAQVRNAAQFSVLGCYPTVAMASKQPIRQVTTLPIGSLACNRWLR
jgi:hypothetical protein